MDETASVPPPITRISGQQMAGDKNGTIRQYGEVRFSSQQIRLFRIGPGFPAIGRTEEQGLLHHLATLTLVLVEGGQ